MKKIILIVLGIVAVVIMIAAFNSFSDTKLVSINDVSNSWEYNNKAYVNPYSSQKLEITIKGTLNKPARFGYTTLPKWHDQMKLSTILPEGEVDIVIYEPEWWCSSCYVRYEPDKATTGNLTVQMKINSEQ